MAKAKKPLVRVQVQAAPVSKEIWDERQRACAIVRAYRFRTEGWAPAHPQLARIRATLIEGFHAMETDIMSGRDIRDKVAPAGDVSLVDLERAQEIINELDTNPFEP